MDTITIEEYLKHALDTELPLKLPWVVSMLSIMSEDGDYSRIVGGSIELKYVDAYVKVEGVKLGQPVLDFKSSISLKAGYIANLNEDVTTTIGKLLLNYVLLVHNFKDKVPYINNVITVGDVEDDWIAPNLKDKPVKPTDISIAEYIAFVDASTYLQNWADLVSVSSTEKSMIAPPNIKALRTKLIAEAKVKHGEDALKDYAVVVEIEKELKAYDREYLKDDPSLDILMGGKILNNSRKKLFLTSGAEKGFKDNNKDAILIEKSLKEGWDKDPELLADMFNSSRHGSYSRGNETFKGGLVAKILLRATSAIMIKGEDCKTTVGKTWTVTDKNYSSIVSRHLIVGKSTVHVDSTTEAKKYIGKDVILRSPMYCHAKGENICKLCAGSGLAASESSVSLLVTSVGATVLAISMKAMHNTSIDSVKIDMNEILS